MLGDRIDTFGPKVWLVNTGWTGGAYGVGERIRLRDTRSLLHAALAGALDGVPFERDPIFGVEVPQRVPGVPSNLLTPGRTWRDQEAFDRTALELARMFRCNFETYADDMSAEVRGAAPGR